MIRFLATLAAVVVCRVIPFLAFAFVLGLMLVVLGLPTQFAIPISLFVTFLLFVENDK